MASLSLLPSVFDIGALRAFCLCMKDEIQNRIEKLKRDIEEASGEKPTFGTAPDCPPEVEEAFLRQVLKCELDGKKRRKPRG